MPPVAKNLKLSRRFILMITITVFVILSLFMVVNIQKSTKDLHKQLIKSATDIGHFVALTSHEALLAYDYLTLNNLMKEISLRENVIYAVILKKDRPITTYLNHANPRLKPLLENQSETVKIPTILVQLRQFNDMEIISFPVETEGNTIAKLELGVSLSKLQQLKRELVIQGLIEMLVLSLILAFLLSFEFHQYVIQPLNEILKGIQNQSLNTPTQPVQVIRQDELGQLADSFNHMMTEISSSHQRLKNEEKRYRSIFNATSDALLIQDAENTKILDVNSRMLELYGLDRDTALSKTLGELSSPLQDYDQGFVLEQFKKAQNGQEAVFEWLAKDNREQPFPVEISLSYAELDKNPRIIASVRDIRQRKLVEKEIEKTKQKYFHQEKIATLGQMVAGVLHEIGNPITAISGAMQQLYFINQDPDRYIECEKLKNENRECLDIVSAHTDRLEGITNEVRNFVSPQASDSEFFDLNNMIERSQGLLRYEKRLKYVDTEYHLDKSISAISGIQEHIVQVFLNLMLNSAAAVHSQQEREPKIIVSTLMDDGYAVLSVTDNGTGMSEEVQEKALMPFFTTKEAGVGTGLGLSLCQTLIEEQNGKLEIISVENIGTEIRVYLEALSEEY